ncbi:hypothetical protein DCC85_07475 [Paenibacillus sp. CAA11]|uniref:hypothetical protein n=1 Tax=Paenibacillus sp. CAA11 TaxID=1532905 RepID=UPI000D3944DE|nr:hypothetical protein [Paenibacillus sp. CAA11]AWB44071.1 hypothetical protein DCC85_07475 [Paenibacillus sp. CAA11]
MYKFILFLHILGALSLGFYVLLPLVIGRLASLSDAAREGTLSVIRSLNRFAQYGLILELLTGGYLVSQREYSVPWMIVVVVLFLIAAGLSGMLGKPLRLAIEAARNKKGPTAELGKIRMFTVIQAVVVLVILFFMVFRRII